MKIIGFMVCGLLAATVFAGQVTYTWNGGNGNWSDAGNWTASDSSSGYPNDAAAIAVFPAGGTYVATFTENIACSNVVMDGEATHVTFRCVGTQFTLTTPKVANLHGIMARSKNGSFTMENIQIYGEGGMYTTAWTSYLEAPGDGGSFTMINGAKVNIVSGHLNGINGKVYIGSGSDFRMGSCYMNPASGEMFLTISNAYFMYSSPGYPAPSQGTVHFVFQGNAPRFQPKAAVAGGGAKVIYEFEIPETQYSYYPIDASEENTLPNMSPSGSDFRVSQQSPAQIAGVTNTWKIVSWESKVKTEERYDNGIVTNQITWGGLKPNMKPSFAWRTGTYAQNPETANPAYMYLTIGRHRGLVLTIQ